MADGRLDIRLRVSSALMRVRVVCASGAFLAGPVMAAATPMPSDVLATVGDEPITRTAFDVELPEVTDPTLPDEAARQEQALGNLIDRRLLWLGARAHLEGAVALEDSARRYDEIAEIWESVRTSFHPDEEALTDEAIESFRDDRSLLWMGRQIVVESEDEIPGIMKRLEDGEDFGELAKEVSIDIGTRAAGGRLMPTRYGDTFPSLYRLMASLLDQGEVGGPVRTRLGYHIARCDSVLYSIEDPVTIPNDRLRSVRRRLPYLEAVDAWTDERVAHYGLAVHDQGVEEIVAHLRPTPSMIRPPHRDPAWEATDTPVVSTEDGPVVTVEEFFELFPALQIEDWPKPRNRFSIRVAATRLAIAMMLHREYRAGTYALSDEALCRVDATLGRFMGQTYLDSETDLSGLDSLVAERMFEERPEAFMLPEQVSIAAIVVSDEAYAEEIHAMLMDGEDFKDVAFRARDVDPEAQYAPRTPFIPRGAFPESDELLFGSEIGSISEPVPVSDGYQIYKVLERRPPRPMRRIELSDETLLSRCEAVIRSEVQAALLEELRTEFPVRRNETLIGELIGASGSANGSHD